jgi:shikimate kinase
MTAGGSIAGDVPMSPSVGGYPVGMGAVGHVVITGLMGAGKTTVGERLAARLGCAWRDSDADIEASTGATVRELRVREGTDAMHEREAAQLLDALASAVPNVISAAASVVEDSAARVALVSPGVTLVWLHASPSLLAERFASEAHRPVYGDSPEAFLADQAARREPLLTALGAHVIDVDDLTPDEVVGRVRRLLG